MRRMGNVPVLDAKGGKCEIGRVDGAWRKSREFEDAARANQTRAAPIHITHNREKGCADVIASLALLFTASYLSIRCFKSLASVP